MPLYVGDYLADTTNLTAAQHGAYLLLLMTYWHRGGPLPDDNIFLANAAKTSKNLWGYTRKVLEPYFEIKDGAWIHKRVEKEILKCCERSAKASQSACVRYASALQLHTHTQIHKEEEKKESKKETALKREPKKQRHVCPEDFQPSESHYKLGADQGFDRKRVDDEAAKMHDWSHGNQMWRADWKLVFNNWLRSEIQKRGNGNGHRPFTTDRARKHDDLMRKVNAFIAEPDGESSGEMGEAVVRVIPERKPA